MEREAHQEVEEDPLLNIFEEGMEEFLHYEREDKEGYKTRTQKHRQKMQKLDKFFNSEAHKKQRNYDRRKAEKIRDNKIVSTMTPQQKNKYQKQKYERRKMQKERVRQAMQTGQVMMIDIAYENRMAPKENKSLAKQIELITKAIKHIEDPPSVHLCSFGGLVQTYLETMGLKYLPLITHIEDIVEVGQKLGKKLVYLSPDAELPLEKVQKDTAYILGGLIDRTIIKNASLIRARNLGIEVRKLPIRQYMKSRSVLNLDHVIAMVMNYRETNDWKKSFDFGAPKRWKKEQSLNQPDKQQAQEKEVEEQQKQETQQKTET